MMFLTEVEEQQCQTVELRFQPESTTLLAACKLEGAGGDGGGEGGVCTSVAGWLCGQTMRWIGE